MTQVIDVNSAFENDEAVILSDILYALDPANTCCKENETYDEYDGFVEYIINEKYETFDGHIIASELFDQLIEVSSTYFGQVFTTEQTEEIVNKFTESVL